MTASQTLRPHGHPVNVYEYGPFGEVIRATGPMANASPFRFSTKFHDEETGLLYYGYRYCSPSLGRCISRDPIEEASAANLYAFTKNGSIDKVDVDGRDMVLREFFYTLGAPPTRGEYANYYGLTFFHPFAPRTLVYRGFEGPCCWKILLTGYADLYSWWVPGRFADDGTDARSHEMQHVAYARETFRGFVRTASSFTGVCHSKGKADCFAAVITGELARAFAATYDTQNMRYDYQVYGAYKAELPLQEQTEAAAWRNLAWALLKCALFTR